jgi:hypothetical protein
MTVSQLYSLYRAGHAEARETLDARIARAHELSVSSAGLTRLEHVILELALLDATNGTAMRSAEGFDRAVEQGADLLRSLGLRVEPPPTRSAGAAPLELPPQLH